MKRYSTAVLVLVLVLVLAGAVMSESAMARGGRGGHGGGHGYGGRIGVGIALGVPLFGLGYYSGYYPYSYPAPAYPGPAMAPSGAYIEQGYAQAAPAPARQQDWYFCAGSNGYYPYVRECPDGWQRVPSPPPR